MCDRLAYRTVRLNAPLRIPYTILHHFRVLTFLFIQITTKVRTLQNRTVFIGTPCRDCSLTGRWRKRSRRLSLVAVSRTNYKGHDRVPYAQFVAAKIHYCLLAMFSNDVFPVVLCRARIHRSVTEGLVEVIISQSTLSCC